MVPPLRNYLQYSKKVNIMLVFYKIPPTKRGKIPLE